MHARPPVRARRAGFLLIEPGERLLSLSRHDSRLFQYCWHDHDYSPIPHGERTRYSGIFHQTVVSLG